MTLGTPKYAGKKVQPQRNETNANAMFISCKLKIEKNSLNALFLFTFKY
ncbi:hypothetical protein PPEP_b0072 [Pseudoalteromonas peptidolytica F12-50-A1]|uniref:Uncharacterized protein n=1 Tax=Pseudoalteromonas peptidolytica F12-50-A1 TaxID=1315280 RepID=A0A8I0MYV0_9GAMM|nr:hypothetical protein [Pseudoalteromonas peptidolytica F12-50-A1]